VAEHLFIAFANSAVYDGRGNLDDRLHDGGWRRTFLEEWGLTRYGPIEATDLEDLAELRSAIRSIAGQVGAGRKPAAPDVGLLNEVLAEHPVRFHLSARDGREMALDVEPIAEHGASTVAAEIALSAARFLADEDLGRLKMCDNAGCRWMFYDATRNRSRRWCKLCGNVDKVRRFRERQRTAGGGQDARRAGRRSR
jgi:predicted RNA-binding Zn ribbon-like protein